LASCRTCHAGAKADERKVASRCDSCHGFHSKVEHPAFGKTAAAKGKP
jgi:predicted Zn-ribbon and HTH transcriptional regulator